VCTLLRAAESGHISHYFKSLIRIQVFIQVHISPWSLALPAGMPPRARARDVDDDVRAYANAWCDWSPTGRSLKRLRVSTQTSPPSIAIAPPVLGGPESVRVVLNSTSSTACVIAGCVGHTSVHSLRLGHSDIGPRAWGSGGCALCVSQQQQHPNLHGPRDLLVLPT
jgi:hypothetical protein